jgi:hypothetical protein
MPRLLTILSAVCCLFGIMVASASARPPRDVDWLVYGRDYPAVAKLRIDGERLVLTNGLIERTFMLGPNGATIGYDNLITGETITRGVKPEAVVTLNGRRFEVGGLKGQPNYAYLDPAWIDELTSDPAALQYIGYETTPIEARLDWKRVRHHAPDVAWPPNGIHVRMDYQLMGDLGALLDDADVASDAGRELLFAEPFDDLGAAWRVHASEAHPRSSAMNEGKPGEIYGLANTCIFVERDLPAGARLIEATFDVGTDRSASWGPGIGLVLPDRTVKFNLRPGSMEVGIHDGRSERRTTLPQDVDLSKPVVIRMRLDHGEARCDVQTINGAWVECLAFPIELPAQGAKLRIGKLGYAGDDRDHGNPGELVRLRMLNASVYGAFDPSALPDRLAELRAFRDVVVSVHYNLYDGIPVMSKWITVRNDGERAVTLDAFTCETLALVEFASWVEDRGVPMPRPAFHVEADYSFGGMSFHNARRKAVRFIPDPDYKTQVHYPRRNPCLLEVGPELGPGQTIEPGGTFESFRAFELAFDSSNRERQGLAIRRMYRTVAPWVTENPLMMHVRYADWDTVKAAIDQCAAVGFEMVILTFGSGFNIENESEEYLAEMKRYADYARSKGIEIGGYSLLSSRRVGGGNDVTLPEGQRPTFGNAPCIGSTWGRDYFRKLYRFYERTGFALLEHDGSYPGDACDSTHHPGHRGHEDSRWNQWRTITDFYKWCRAKGVYLNVPDYYYLAGSSKSGMGYRETNWSLPRAQQVIHTRQNIYDGTWTKTPSMGWMFVPLTQYHGGGAAATIEPLREHLDHYGRMLSSNLALGAQACYRGPRLFDAPETETLVRTWVDWYKRHRDILESDLIHGRRADGRDLDWMLHVNPALETSGMLVVFNPLDHDVSRTIRVGLYYTGLTDAAVVTDPDGAEETVRLGRDYDIELTVSVPAGGMTWRTLRAP